MSTNTLSRLLFTFFFLAFVAFNADAQLKKTLHQTFDIEEAEKVTIDLAGEVEIITWAGNTIMSHTFIELSDARESILNYYIGEGRYDIEGNLQGDTYTLVSKDKERRLIQYKDIQCYEFTKVKLFVPDDFKLSNQNTLVRMRDTEETVSSEN